MEWNKVKSMLIALLLVVNILLGLNIQAQLSAQRADEEESLHLALSLLADAGAQFDEQLFWNMPRSSAVLLGERSTEREAQLAGTLLGEASLNEAGGGVSIYTSSAGSVTFRSGGLFEAELNDGTGPEELLGLIVETAAIKGMDYEMSAEGESVSAQLLLDGWTVAGAALTCRSTETGALASGRWYFGSEPVSEGAGVGRAEMVVALVRIAQERPLDITGLQLVYTQEQLRSGVRLSPAWRIDLGDEQIFLNGNTAQEVSVE